MRAERKLEAHPATASAAVIAVSQNATRLPDFVPVINFDQFLLAAQQSDVGQRDDASPAARLAAVALSTKFSVQAPADPDRTFLSAIVQQDPVAREFVEKPEDPKKLVQMAALEAQQDDQSDAEQKDSGADISEPARLPRADKSEEHRSSRRVTVSRSGSKSSVVRRARQKRHHGQHRVAAAQTQEQSGSSYSGITSYLAPIIGFKSLSPDRRLTTKTR